MLSMLKPRTESLQSVHRCYMLPLVPFYALDCHLVNIVSVSVPRSSDWSYVLVTPGRSEWMLALICLCYPHSHTAHHLLLQCGIRLSHSLCFLLRRVLLELGLGVEAECTELRLQSLYVLISAVSPQGSGVRTFRVVAVVQLGVRLEQHFLAFGQARAELTVLERAGADWCARGPTVRVSLQCTSKRDCSWHLRSTEPGLAGLVVSQ